MTFRVTRKKWIRVKLESAYGVDPGGWSASDAVLLAGDPTHRVIHQNVPRELVRRYLGASQHLAGARVMEVSFKVELAGSGTQGTAPAYGRLLRACAMSETVVTDPPNDRVEYTPVSDAQESAHMRYSIDGAFYRLAGCRGNVRFTMNAYDRPLMEFTLTGFDVTAAESSVFSTDFSAYQTPDIVTDAASGDVSFGAVLANGTVSGGTAYPSLGMTVDLGNDVRHMPLLGGEHINIVSRETTGETTVFLTAAQEVAWWSDVRDNALSTLGFRLSSVNGRSVRLYAPAVQRVEPTPVDQNGLHGIRTGLRFLPTGNSGNNEIRLIVR